MPNVVIGLDPGMRTMCAAVREDLRSRRLRPRLNRKKRRKQPPRQLRKKPSRPIRAKKKPPKHRSGRDIVSVSASEYYNTANFNQFRTWHEGLKVRHPADASAIREMPSFKTASYEVYLEGLRYFWTHLHGLLAFHAEWPFLKWKFLRKRMARIALDEIAARIVAMPSLLTCVAYGNWRSSGGIKGHARCSNKGLKKALEKRAMVVSMDEFRTSKCCSACHRELSKVSYPVDVMLAQRKKRRGQVIARNRVEVQFEFLKCHAVLRCDNPSCEPPLHAEFGQLQD